MKGHQVTIKDIARALNISKSTVSRALTGHANVNEETRKKVLEMAISTDYQKNIIATNLIKGRSKTIGIIVPDFSSSFFPSIIVEVQQIAKQKDYLLLIMQSNESYETEVANAKLLLGHQVDGLLVSISQETLNFDHFKIFDRKNIPIVFFNRVCDEMMVPKVLVDDYEGAFSATEHLIKIGKKRIAHLAGPRSLSISKKRLNGYMDALKQDNYGVDEDLIIECDLSPDKVKIYINHLLKIKNPPDAIFCINDPSAIQAIQIIESMGLKIPEDIAVVGFSNDFASELIGLTTVAQPVKDIGCTAAQLLFDQIESDKKKAIIKQLKTNLIIRSSTVKSLNCNRVK
ncbi:LacI family DNA-binding transcriptional regulator [Mucilaginibacter sp.]|jgi:LacI family transcriptional regulator/LacI family repressor for deo operon, udp, cdd, tsx, nupC, and nupG|uniref:LacI family DNA-binding transcriptional regulator n=1 Tax=Mucilaginibacter sp. TaxID=1882438 RepID=UPI003563E0AA